MEKKRESTLEKFLDQEREREPSLRKRNHWPACWVSWWRCTLCTWSTRLVLAIILHGLLQIDHAQISIVLAKIQFCFVISSSALRLVGSLLTKWTIFATASPSWATDLSFNISSVPHKTRKSSMALILKQGVVASLVEVFLFDIDRLLEPKRWNMFLKRRCQIAFG